ncbi:hypothetical protein NIM87_00130 [Devosia sp. XJ19-1]|uniref:Uncharacterized protein n=1 Tax=Devosia ureilytica TaxID=2952754 RepID=A0A9Q4FRG7_9HYPH|nr:hypothetical protein [Devosia ureilytica]MCP8881907.1 hypothetical protein [Devosia ureilytica]MCP8886207.1 hypothetical protein [Devosia ureilytica]
MSDQFDTFQNGLTAPATRATAITPHDANDLAFVTRAIYVGGAGDLSVIMRAGDTVTFSDVPAGTLLPIRVSRVLAATSATDVVGLA